ncbi:hypothetical protein [Clostridium grantii]|uniref:Uncharacterized protein n=1 Tax=Clostridium grantii DSM 8605 TaxID=1121316 RepID=A0A1M5SDF3_9CLOT|nr:hypothetical protein [Clostridium grantii]SHH36501.1 hypothetical protein SAMN02745207_00878 [Clostridium grantii DSM 8605]
MCNCLVYPYANKIEMLDIISGLKNEGKKYSNVGNAIFVMEYVENEKTPGKLIWEDRNGK